MNDHAPAPRSGAHRLVLILVLATAAALGLFLSARLNSPAPGPALQGTLLYPQPRELADFKLDGAAGTSVGKAELQGRWTLLFIGFTHCPDVCPTTLNLLAAAAKQWQDLPEDQHPRILFVSVDPERDTPDAIADYAHFFSPDILSATADQERLQPFTRELGLVYMQTPLPDGGYTVDHSASVSVLDPQVRLVASIRPPLQAAVIAADVRALLESRR